jgi:Tfp pilus assembly protein PilF
LLQDGLLIIKQQDYKGSRASLEEALKQQPQEWRALEALALSYVAEKKLDKATAVVREYTFLNSATAKLFLGSWLSRTGDRVGARAAFRAAKSLAPDSAAADFESAELDLREGKLDSARTTLLALLGKQPGNLALILDLGQAEYRAGRLTEAIGYYEKAVQEDPKNVPALNNLAYLLADTRKNPDRALQLAQQVKELSPNDTTVDDTIGWAYYNKGIYQTAVEYLSLSKTTTPRWKCHLAMAYVKVGRPQQAGAMLQAALKEDPEVPEAQKVLALLASAR